jgi:hypothetical protein
LKKIKKKDYENLTAKNIQKVIELLNPSEGGQPITKKQACEVLNIAYNTTRLNSIIEEFVKQQEYTKKRKSQNRGRAATPGEIQDSVSSYLEGESIAEIAKRLYRSPSFVKAIIDRVGVPEKQKAGAGTQLLPDPCVGETFEPKEIVWSACYNAPAIVDFEVTNKDYEKEYGAKCYQLYVMQKVQSHENFFPGVEMGGFYAYSAAYDIGKLTHLADLGINLKNLERM